MIKEMRKCRWSQKRRRKITKQGQIWEIREQDEPTKEEVKDRGIKGLLAGGIPILHLLPCTSASSVPLHVITYLPYSMHYVVGVLDPFACFPIVFLYFFYCFSLLFFIVHNASVLLQLGYIHGPSTTLELFIRITPASKLQFTFK
eukprot:TRINITY_DN12405_c0_g2_i1.p1 TRINITY_DN12405_c0_g2~~TRINITY_DN12405_c0_g2_i1.p1  ORF type:complete len:145 (+),score=24.12 TRINITY_DN12405_c0_g2_i1:769-1203(+)